MCYMPYSSPSSWFDRPNGIWWGVQSIKLDVTQSSLLSCYLVFLRPKFPTQHPILENPQPMFLPQCEWSSFIPIQNNTQSKSIAVQNVFHSLLASYERRRMANLKKLRSQKIAEWLPGATQLSRSKLELMYTDILRWHMTRPEPMAKKERQVKKNISVRFFICSTREAFFPAANRSFVRHSCARETWLLKVSSAKACGCLYS